MSADLEKRLRAPVPQSFPREPAPDPLRVEAAAALARQREEIARLNAALDETRRHEARMREEAAAQIVRATYAEIERDEARAAAIEEAAEAIEAEGEECGSLHDRRMAVRWAATIRALAQPDRSAEEERRV